MASAGFLLLAAAAAAVTVLCNAAKKPDPYLCYLDNCGTRGTCLDNGLCKCKFPYKYLYADSALAEGVVPDTHDRTQPLCDYMWTYTPTRSRNHTGELNATNRANVLRRLARCNMTNVVSFFEPVFNRSDVLCLCKRTFHDDKSSGGLLCGKKKANERDVGCEDFDRFCRNGGVCRNSGAGPVCTCKGRFSGLRCHIVDFKCKGITCPANEFCVAAVANDSMEEKCHCRLDHVDPTGGCQATKVKECTSHQDCNVKDKDATCTRENKCSCSEHWMGRRCISDVNECALGAAKCSDGNGGKCINIIKGFKCACFPGYEGADCNYDKNECSIKNRAKFCPINHGNCTNFDITITGKSHSCVCKAEFTGDTCQTSNAMSCWGCKPGEPACPEGAAFDEKHAEALKLRCTFPLDICSVVKRGAALYRECSNAQECNENKTSMLKVFMQCCNTSLCNTGAFTVNSAPVLVIVLRSDVLLRCALCVLVIATRFT